MELGTCLIIYLVVTIIFIIIFIRACIRPWSAIVLGLLIGFIVLNAICPPSCLDPWHCSTSLFAVYLLIEVATIIIILIYVVMAAWRDREVPQMRIEITSPGERRSTTIVGAVAEKSCLPECPPVPTCSTSKVCFNDLCLQDNPCLVKKGKAKKC